MNERGLRLVCFHVLPMAWGLVQEWAAQRGHRVLLLVTTPGPTSRRSDTYKQVVTMSPPSQDVMVTTRLRGRALPLIRELAPDLILSFTFPYRLPPEITTLPRLGAVNLHPTPLPLYRGPNPMRVIYDGHPVLGATLHRTEEDFDTGLIYHQAMRPMPESVSAETVFPVWRGAMWEALDEGVRRYVAGAPGEAQDHSRATYAANFSDADHQLDWSLSRRTLQCRTAALGFFGRPAEASIDGRRYLVRRVTPLPDSAPVGATGSVVRSEGGVLTVRAGDGLVAVEAEPV